MNIVISIHLDNKSFNDVPLNLVFKHLKASIFRFLFEPSPDLKIIKEVLDIIIKVLNLELKRNREAIKAYFNRTFAIYLPSLLEERYRYLRYPNSAIDLGVTKSELLSIIHMAPREIQIMFENKLNRFLLGDLDQILCQEFMPPIWIAEEQRDTSKKSNLEWLIDQSYL